MVRSVRIVSRLGRWTLVCIIIMPAS